MVCLSCTATGERVMLAAEGFGNRHCFLENIADKNVPPDLSQCVFVIEQALSVRALQELVTAAGSESVCIDESLIHIRIHSINPSMIDSFSFVNNFSTYEKKKCAQILCFKQNHELCFIFYSM